MEAARCTHRLGPLFHDRPTGGTVATHPACAAKLLVRLTGGDPEGFLGYEPTEESPRTNTYELLELLLDVLTDTIARALEDADDDTYVEAKEDREALILVYADALRSPRFAEAVWLHIVTRGPDAAAEAAG